MADNQSCDDQVVRTVVVVGGGSAGWIAACRLAAQARRSGSVVAVRLVESATVPTIGVGEGTWPTMRNTLARIGIGETATVTIPPQPSPTAGETASLTVTVATVCGEQLDSNNESTYDITFE